MEVFAPHLCNICTSRTQVRLEDTAKVLKKVDKERNKGKSPRATNGTRNSSASSDFLSPGAGIGGERLC